MNLIGIILFTLPSLLFANLNFGKDFSINRFEFDKFKQEFNQQFFAGNDHGVIELEEKKYNVEYTLNKTLEKQVKRYLRRYRSDYASVVIVDNNTGNILTAIDYTRETRKFSRSLSFSSTNPAASVFKVITAADLLENKKITKDTKFSYSGKGSTLYKYQLKNRRNRWTRSIPFKKAFAYSNNVVFGKAAQKNTTASSLTKMANKFGFNEDLFTLLDVGESQLFTSTSKYGLAELASGFNKTTMISPIHGALIASVVANTGILKNPKLVKKVTEVGKDRVLWQPKEEKKRIITLDSARELADMMKLTVKSGTARGAFRPWRAKRIKDIEVAGKTGSITGGIPYGKRDWFVSYAKPKKNKSDAGISVSVMNVNVKKWYIKSSHLAKKIIQYYYVNLKKDEKI